MVFSCDFSEISEIFQNTFLQNTSIACFYIRDTIVQTKLNNTIIFQYFSCLRNVVVYQEIW